MDYARGYRGISGEKLMDQDKSVSMAAAGLVVGAVAFMVAITFLFRGSVHF